MMILGTIIATIVLGVGYFIGAYDDLLNSGVSTITPQAGIELILISIPIILAMYSNIIIKIKRLHDINFSGWWFLVFLLLCLPYIALYFWLGTKGRNRFDVNYKSQEKDLNNTSLTKAVYNHSKDIASEIKPTINEYKAKHSSFNTTIKEKTSSIPNNLNVDEIYEKIMIEIEEDKKVKSTWGRALAKSEGNIDKAEALYINFRVKMITKDNSLKTEENYKVNNKENMLEKILKEKNLKIKKMINDDLFLVYDISCKSNTYYLDYINEVWTVYK